MPWEVIVYVDILFLVRDKIRLPKRMSLLIGLSRILTVASQISFNSKGGGK